MFSNFTDYALIHQTGDAHYIFLTTCKVIMDNATDFIRWPNRDEYNAISENFQLPYTIGTFSDDIN